MLFRQCMFAWRKANRPEQGVPSSVNKALDALLPQQLCPPRPHLRLGVCFAGPKYLVKIVGVPPASS